MIRQVLACAVACALLGACAHPPPRGGMARPYYPVIDPKTSVGQGENYSFDVAQCQAQAAEMAQDRAGGEVVGSALVGAALGAAIGAAAGAPSGNAAAGAAIGAGAGAVAGTARGAHAAGHVGSHPQVVINCMRGRGYNVLY